jgi:hypothetical protein
MIARQGAHPRRHPLCEERSTRLVRGMGTRPPLSVLRRGGRPRRCRRLLSAAKSQFSTSTLRCARIPFRRCANGCPGAHPKPASAILPRSSLRRSQGRADHRTWTPGSPWPASWTRVMTRLGRVTDRDRDFSRSADRRRVGWRAAFRSGVFFPRGAMIPATDAPFHRAGRQRVPRAATRTSSRMQRTTLHLGEIQGAFHR